MVDSTHAFAAKFGSKIYFCYGYIVISNTINQGSIIFETATLLGDSSVILINSSSGESIPLIYLGDRALIVPNRNILSGYYYVCGTFIEA